MDSDIPTKNQLALILPRICDSETSADPAGWTAANPLWGHCAVVSLLAQDLYGGELLRASLEHIPALAHVRSHYWNRFEDGETDFTLGQFAAQPLGLQPSVRTRAYVMSSAETVRRYKLLAWRLARHLSGDTPIFGDAIYRHCFMAALDSPCKKLRFGCVVTRQDSLVYEGCNATIGPLACLCEPECIRLHIPSRTESMIGACGHSEELALWELVRRGVPLGECDLYVAGLRMAGQPLFKTEAEFTCLRCAVQMYHAGIKSVLVPLADGWARLSAEEALKSAIPFATQAKKL